MGLIRWMFVEKPVDEITVATVEKKFGVRFPSDYRECVQKYNGGYPKPQKFDFDNGTQGVFNDLISFTDEVLNIQMFFDFKDDPCTMRIVPFGRDPFGNLLCFDFRNSLDKPQIVFYDHEEKIEDAITPICTSFTELLERMYSLEENKDNGG
ncbi:SMI1/KNR4 family protein [Brevibacillus brevis]|uniref:SMI1/KNR4 family protein n=1 Tax=Brevibacillus brevis TaxID=1393 RepID=UPI0007D8A222|nr:SMI1/KNR4 family protein [Brevibacillus brevis]WGV58804.1 SMI1/KNR4 family protein [Brevibacillus brevis]